MGILSQSNSVDKAREMFRAIRNLVPSVNGLVIVLGAVYLTFNLYYNYPIITIIQVIQV